MIIYYLCANNIKYMNIIKSQNDSRKYKSIILPNKLEALLISDPNTDVGAASLSIHIGSYYDPIEYLGLAHFLEHMLFMGTEKYSDENYYFKYLNEHGGISNAYTSGESTNYFFDVNVSHFPTALDIFSQFFIAPLFNKDAIKREINAIDSEHSKNIISNDWRIKRIMETVSRKEHPFHKFSTGNKNTMKSDIREKMINFYNKYYSANLMKLVIMWNKSLDDCEKMVRILFNSVKNNNVSRNTYDGQPYDINTSINNNGLCHKLIKMIPVSDINILNIVWQLPNMDKYFKNKPTEYIFKLLDYESDGGIYSALKSKGWGKSVSNGIYETDDSMYLYILSVELTDKGYIYIPTIIDIIYSYIDIIKNSIHTWIYNEMKNIHEKLFKYIDKINPINYVSSLSENMLKYPIQYVVSAEYIFDPNINKKVIQKCLSYIQNKHSIVVLNSKKFKLSNPLKEKYYGISYTIENNPTSYGIEFDTRRENFSSPNINKSYHKPKLFLPKKKYIYIQKFKTISQNNGCQISTKT